MKQRYGLYLVLAIGVLAGGGAVSYFLSSAMSATEIEAAPATPAFVREGYILKGHPALDPEIWYLIHSSEGENALAAKLRFNEASICGNETVSGACAPDIFVNERPARVEGMWDGEDLVVTTLTFIQPVD